MVSPRSRPTRRMSSPSFASLSWRSFMRTILTRRRSHLHITRLRLHPCEPGVDALVAREIEAGIDPRGIRIGEQRHVADRVRLAHEEVAAGEVLLHHVERLVAALAKAG